MLMDLGFLILTQECHFQYYLPNETTPHFERKKAPSNFSAGLTGESFLL